MSDRTGCRLGIAALAVSIMASALAQVALKTGVMRADLLSLAGNGEWTRWLASSSSPGMWWIAAGLASYAVSLLAWLQVLARLPLSVAYPLLGVSYVLVYAAAIASPILAEELTFMRAAGVLLVACGAGLVSASTRLGATRRTE